MNVRLVGVRPTAGAVPVPLTATVCGLSGALSAIWTAAERAPIVVGENTAEIEQVALGANVDGLSGQSLVELKSPALVPVSPIPVIVSGDVPVFRMTVDCEALEVPTRWEENARLPGVVPTVGPALVALYTLATIAFVHC